MDARFAQFRCSSRRRRSVRRRNQSSVRFEGRDRSLSDAANCKWLNAIKSRIREMWNEISRERSEVSLRRKQLKKEKEKFEKKLGTLGPDIPLAVVAKQFKLLISDLTDIDAVQHCDLVRYPYFSSLYREIVQLHRRSRNMLVEFGSFNCIRLVLDKQSPLATQFADFFTDLQWLLVGLITHIEASNNGQTDVSAPLNHIHACSGNPTGDKIDTSLLERCRSILAYIKPVVFTCIVLHSLYKSSRWFHSEDSPFQRAVKHDGRMFTDDLYHCYSRSFGHLNDWNLDSFKDTRVELSEECLGQGGYASVCKGYFVQTASGEKIDDPVAIKVICHPSFGTKSDSFSELFSSSCGDDIRSPQASGRRNLRSCLFGFSNSSSRSCNSESEPPHASELQKLALLQHPNIVEVKGYINQRELMHGSVAQCGIVMELMDWSLDKVIRKMHDDEDDNVPLYTELEFVDVMLEIARAIRFLHENGVTHRDLKPANILLRSSHLFPGAECREVKLGDFGLTKCINSEQHYMHSVETKHTTFVGTSGFMAPEIRVTYDKVAYTDKVDIYSYGITCLDIITGIPHRKLESGKYKELYEAVDAGDWENWLKNAMPCCQQDLIDTIRSCLYSEPTCRSTAAEICFMLQQIKWRLLWPCPNETESALENSLRGASANQFSDLVEQRIVAGLILGRVVSNELSGSKLMKALLEEVPESAYTSFKVYFPAALQDERDDEMMSKVIRQSQKWRNEVLAKAMKNVIVMNDCCQTSLIMSRSESFLHTLEDLCNDLVDHIFMRFCYTRDLPIRRECNCVVSQHLREEKLSVHEEGRMTDIVKGFPRHILKVDGIYRLSLFGDLVDEYFGVKFSSSTFTKIETMRDLNVRKYLLYHGFFAPILKTKVDIRDAFLDFKRNWVKHEVIFTLFRWSYIWKTTLDNVIQVPCAEDVVDYCLICRNPSLSRHTLSGYFELSLHVFLKACKAFADTDDDDDASSSYVDEDESMLPLLKSFYMLYR